MSDAISVSVPEDDDDHGHYWFRLHQDGTTFIAFHAEDGLWYLPGIQGSVDDIEGEATLLGRVARYTDSGKSIDQ